MDAEPIRISDTERNQAIERLNTFYAEGRLDLDECSARMDEVYAARTDADLRNALRELPPPEQRLRPVRVPGLRSTARRAAELSTPAAVCTVVWAITGHGHSFWPEWVWLGTGLVFIRGLRGRRTAILAPDHRQEDHQLGHRAGLPAPSGHDSRKVLTAVFTDIVGSTELAASMGDGPWRSRLRSFEHLSDQAMAERQGRVLFTKGDEVVATFLTTTQAIEYARAVRDGTAKLGLSVRVGIHTGELEGRRKDLSGIALHIGQRVSAAAQPNEILVTSTVRDLAQGSGIEFNDRGEHELRGLPGNWRLYALGTSH
jgi:class 3 adenylate cyclase